MRKEFSGVLFLVLLLSMTFVLAGTTEITVRMGNDYNALIKVKDGGVFTSFPIKNYPMGLAEFTHENSESQGTYLIIVHQNGDVVDSYSLDNIDTGSELLVDFRGGVPPIVTDLKELAVETVVEDVVDDVVNDTVVEAVVEESGEPAFDFTKGLSTGKAIFYSDEGFTVFSWILLGFIILVGGWFAFGALKKDKNREEVDKYKSELESIKKKIRKKIREIKILKVKGMKLKKMIELEQGFLDEKKDFKNVEKEVDAADKEEKKDRD
jgi:hypothetical protein